MNLKRTAEAKLRRRINILIFNLIFLIFLVFVLWCFFQKKPTTSEPAKPKFFAPDPPQSSGMFGLKEENKIASKSPRIVRTLTSQNLPPLPSLGMVRIAAIQFAAEFGAPEANRRRLSELIELAAERGAQIVVMPETAIPGYMSEDRRTTWRDARRRPSPKDGRDVAAVAEPIPGKSSAYFSALAKRLKIWLVATLVEDAPKPLDSPLRVERVCFNTALLLDPKGKIRLHHRKIRLWPPGDATWAERGDRPPMIVETPLGRIGLMICYEAAEVLPQLAKQGADFVLYPVGWVDHRPPELWFGETLPNWAKEYSLCIAAANWSAQKPPPDVFGWGFSSIISVEGRILAQAQTTIGDEIVFGDIPHPSKDAHKLFVP
jgi:predicted amidohydrolase